VSQCGAVGCRVLIVWCSVLTVWCSVVQYVAVCRSVVQCGAMCCSVLQCVSSIEASFCCSACFVSLVVCSSVLQYVEVLRLLFVVMDLLFDILHVSLKSRVHIHTCTCAPSHTPALLYTNANAQTHTRAKNHTHAQKITHTCTHTQIHTWTHTHTRWLIHTHIKYTGRCGYVSDTWKRKLCVTWLIHMCDMTHSYVTWVMNYTWCVYHITDTWKCKLSFIRVTCDVTHSVIRVTWLFHTCDMTPSHVTWVTNYIWNTHSFVWSVTRFANSFAWHDSFICVTWLIPMWHESRTIYDGYITLEILGSVSCVRHDLFTAQIYAWHDSPICVTWLTLTSMRLGRVSCVFDMIKSWHNSMRDITPPYMWHDSLSRVTQSEV